MHLGLFSLRTLKVARYMCTYMAKFSHPISRITAFVLLYSLSKINKPFNRLTKHTLQHNMNGCTRFLVTFIVTPFPFARNIYWLFFLAFIEKSIQLSTYVLSNTHYVDTNVVYRHLSKMLKL